MRQICTVNPEFIVDAQQDAAFRARIAGCRPVRCRRRRRGVGGCPTGEACAGARHRLGWYLSHLRTRRTTRLATFLSRRRAGGRRDAAATLTALYPGLQVAGCYSGSPYAADWPEIVARLRRQKPIWSSSLLVTPSRISGFIPIAPTYPPKLPWAWAARLILLPELPPTRATMDAQPGNRVVAPADHAAVAVAAHAEVAALCVDSVPRDGPSQRSQIVLKTQRKAEIANCGLASTS